MGALSKAMEPRGSLVWQWTPRSFRKKIRIPFVTVYRDVFLALDLYSDSFSAPLDLTHGFRGRRLRPEAYPYPGGAACCAQCNGITAEFFKTCLIISECYSSVR